MTMAQFNELCARLSKLEANNKCSETSTEQANMATANAFDYGFATIDSHEQLEDNSENRSVCCDHSEAPCETFNAIGQTLGEEDCIAYVSGRDESYQSD